MVEVVSLRARSCGLQGVLEFFEGPELGNKIYSSSIGCVNGIGKVLCHGSQMCRELGYGLESSCWPILLLI